MSSALQRNAVQHAFSACIGKGLGWWRNENDGKNNRHTDEGGQASEHALGQGGPTRAKTRHAHV